MTLYYFDGYPVDAVLESDDTAESEVTDFEVEEGDDFTDHIRNKSREATFTVIVSNAPLAEVAAARGGAIDGVSFVDEALAKFEQIRSDRQPITIEAPLRTYDNMALTSLGEPMAVEDGDSQRFEVSFKQITTIAVSRAVVTLPRAKSLTHEHLIAILTGGKIMVFDPYTRHVGWYDPATKITTDSVTGLPSTNPGGFAPVKLDPKTGRYVDAKTGLPFEQGPVGIGDTSDAAEQARVDAAEQAQFDQTPWWKRGGLPGL